MVITFIPIVSLWNMMTGIAVTKNSAHKTISPQTDARKDAFFEMLGKKPLPITKEANHIDMQIRIGLIMFTHTPENNRRIYQQYDHRIFVIKSSYGEEKIVKSDDTDTKDRKDHSFYFDLFIYQGCEHSK